MANQKVPLFSAQEERELRKQLSLLLCCSQASQSQDIIINQLLHFYVPDKSKKDPSLTRFRYFSAALIEQLIILLQDEHFFKPSRWTDFFELLNYFPLSSENSIPHNLKETISSSANDNPFYNLITLFPCSYLIFLLNWKIVILLTHY